ncbi:MAG: hypothetical protein AAF211_04205 [Myxococcota bacterium]
MQRDSHALGVAMGGSLLLSLVACNPTLVTVTEGPTTEDPSAEQPIESEPSSQTAPCLVDEEVSADVYLRRVKGLLTGAAPTDDELLRIQADPEALSQLVAEWQALPAYREKLAGFFRKTLQQEGSDLNLRRQLLGSDNARRIPDELENAARAAFVRTAVRIATDGEPFTAIADTRTWELNTALMAWLTVLDRHPETDGIRYYTDPVTRDGVEFDANTPIDVQIANQTFYSATLDPSCPQPYALEDSNANLRRTDAVSRTVEILFGGRPDDDFCDVSVEGLFGPETYADWRTVTMIPRGFAERGTPFFDTVQLSETDTLALELPRTGFFTSPAFLATWETNDDNSFRVITNQALIVGLGIQFDSEDTTLPLGDEGLADEHAAPGTACYGCHKNLDPMRNYFRNSFTSPYYSRVDWSDDDAVWEIASFSFQGYQGVTDDGGTLADFGTHLASHPRFATGWVDKLCFYANSSPCDKDDPEYDRIVSAFTGSGHDFSVLVRELFSSPLVTRASCAEDYERVFPPASIARKEHLCTALAERLQVPDVCDSNRSRARDLADSLPEDVWPRGRETPDQPTVPSLVYTATTDALCRAVASNVVNRTDGFSSNDIEGSLDRMVTQLMAIPPSDALYEPVRARLAQVVTEAEEAGANGRDRLSTAFVVACSSPFVTTVDL